MPGMLHYLVVPTHRLMLMFIATHSKRARTIYVRERLIFASFLNQDAGPRGMQVQLADQPE